MSPAAIDEEKRAVRGGPDPKGGWLSQGAITGQLFCLAHFGFYFALFLFEITSWAGQEERVKHYSGYIPAPGRSPHGPFMGLIQYGTLVV